MIKIARIFFYFFVAFLPFQIDALVVSREVYFSGFFNPYFSHFVYLSDLFLLLSLLFFALDFVFNSRDSARVRFDLFGNKTALAVFLFVSTYFVTILFATDKLNSLFYALRILEFVFVYLLISKKFVDKKKILIVFSGVMGACAMIGILQYFFQESLGLRFFGEPVLSSKELGIAKIDFGGEKILRSYGTFPHPNIFASYLLVAMFSLMSLWNSLKSRKYLFGLLFGLILLSLILTFSRTAILGLIVGMAFFAFSQKLRLRSLVIVIAGLIFVGFSLNFSKIFYERFLFSDKANIQERLIYIDTSFEMFKDNPLGVGAGNFTLEMQKYYPGKFMPWEFQPVHNVFLLVLTELGVFGFSALLFLVWSIVSTRKKNPAFLALGIALMVVFLTDHFFISLYQGQALFYLYLGLISDW